jgi:glycosyltransferase involved in cell wall biosynthesis
MSWLALNAERLIVRRAKEVVFESEYDAGLAKEHAILRDSSVRSSIIRNGIPFRGGSVSRAAEPGHVGFIGRLETQKDPMLFLDVVEQLPGYTATMVGGGTLEGEVEDRIRRDGLTRVESLGALSHEESLEVLSRFYVLVMTSRWEGLPILPLEAMKAGVPVVATNVGALDEVIEDGESGILVDRSLQDIAQAVSLLNQDKSFRERIVENGRRRVSALFSEERMLSEILDVYRRTAER